MEDKDIKINEEDQIIIKTICDFLFYDQYGESASFSRFERCFQPLFNNISISLEKVFIEICGKNKKYITYKRFAKAYIDYLNTKNLSEDTKTFFDLLLKKILKKIESSVGEFVEKANSFSTRKISARTNYISKLQVLTDKNRELHGINIEYDKVFKAYMHPKKIEDDLFVSLEMEFKINDDNEVKKKENLKIYKLIHKIIYQDAITHVFGTLNKENKSITFIGFKCVSGKTVYVGIPKGEGFLFGKFGYKFHDLNLLISTKGISRLEPGFRENIRKNNSLEKAHISSYNDLLKELKGEIIKEEKLFVNLKNESDINKLITTDLIREEELLNKSLKDEYRGYDYKEVVEQKPRGWIRKAANFIENKLEKGKVKKLELKDALKKYKEESESTKKKINNNMGLDLSRESSSKTLSKDTKKYLYLHETKKYKTQKKNKDSKDDNISLAPSMIEGKMKFSIVNLNEKSTFKNKSFVVLNKLDYQSYQEKLGEMINKQIYEEKKIERDYVQINKCLEEYNENENEQEKKNTKRTKIKMKDLKGEIVDLKENKNPEKNWEKLSKKLEKLNGVYLLQTIGAVIKAKNILKNKLNVSLDEKIKLYELLDQNKKIFNFLAKKGIQVEDNEDNGDEDEDDIFLIPNSEVSTPLSQLEKDIEQLKELIKGNSIEKEKNKLEKLLNLYIQQKNIIIEEKNEKARDELINENDINVNRYINEEKEKRDKTKQEEEEKLKKEMEKRKKEQENKSRNNSTIEINIIKEKTLSNKSVDAKKKSSRIFHKQEKPKDSAEFTDNSFEPNEKSLYPQDENGHIFFFEGLEEDDVKNWEKLEWCRINEIDEYEDYTVFYEGANVDDIMQGEINDCYFLSALGSLSSVKGFISDLFDTKERSDNNSYGIYFYINGKWKIVYVDDHFPYMIEEYEFKRLYFSQCVNRQFDDDAIKEIWISLLEKAWAKINGSYARIGCRGFSNEVFDVLTEAYTEHLDLNKRKDYLENHGEKLWKKLEESFTKNYVLSCGSRNIEENGIEPLHAYTLINIYKVNSEIRLVKLKNPHGTKEYSGPWSAPSGDWTSQYKEKCKYKKEEEQFGIFYMPFDYFIETFDEIDIAKIKNDYQTTYYKVSKGQAIKCQAIKLIIEEDNPNTYIQLYQKNPRIMRKDGTYPKKVNSFIILVDSDFKYIKGASGKDPHLAIEVDLKPGTYYIFCDVNYRNEYKENKNFGYTLTFYAKNRIKNFKNVTDKINVISSLELSMFYYCRMKIKDIKDDNGLKIYDSKIPNKEIPFRVLCFLNTTKKSMKIKLGKKGEKSNNYCIYNDNIASEFDKYVIKEIKPMNAATILFMGYDLSKKYEIDYDIISDGNEETFETNNPVFENEGNNLDEEGYLMYYYSEVGENGGKGCVLGLENKSNHLFKLKLTLKEMYNIDGDFNMKDNIEFEILPNSKKVFNFRKKLDAKDPKFDFEQINKK